MNRKRLRPLAAALVLGAALMAPSGAAAAEGSVGPHYAQASCLGAGVKPEMVVSPPQIFSSVPRPQPGISIIGSQHNQVVAYKVNIFYSADAVNWQFSSTSSWRAASVGDAFNTLGPASLWYDYDSAKWVSDTLTWNLLLKGYYRAAVLFYWFADSVSDAGSDYVWADHFDYDTTSGGVFEYCTVP